MKLRKEKFIKQFLKILHQIYNSITIVLSINVIVMESEIILLYEKSKNVKSVEKIKNEFRNINNSIKNIFNLKFVDVSDNPKILKKYKIDFNEIPALVFVPDKKSGDKIKKVTNINLESFFEIMLSILKVLEKNIERIEEIKILKAIAESMSEGVLVIDRNRSIIYVNKFFEEITNFTRNEIMGKHCRIICEKLKIDTSLCELDVVFREGVSKRKVKVSKKDGKKYLEIKSIPLKINGEIKYVVEIIRDLTEEIEKGKELAIVEHMSKLLSQGAPKEYVLQKVVEGFVRSFDYTAAAIHLLSRDKRFLIITAYAAAEKSLIKMVEKFAKIRIQGYKIPLFEGSIFKEVIDKKRPVVTEDIKKLIEHHTLNKKLRILAPIIQRFVNIRCGVGVPLMSGDKVLGIFGVVSKRMLTQKDIRRLLHFSRVIGERVEKSMLFEELEEANKLKTLFVDILAHDLLNYVGIIKNAVQFLKEEISNEEVNMIERNVIKIEEMIKNMKKYVKLESIEEIKFKKMDLAFIIKEVIENFRPLAEEKNIKIETRFEKEIMIAEVNEIIEDVFSNILSNAIKYSFPGGKIEIEAYDENKYWRISIKDYGIGIRDEDKERIFERFVRAEKKGIKGTGLGLAIVKKIVELHNGRVWVEDNKPRGSIFHVLIPKEQKLFEFI